MGKKGAIAFSASFNDFIPIPSRPVALLFGMLFKSLMTCWVLIGGTWNTVASLMWDLMKLSRRASYSFEFMQSGTEILVCWMLTKCSLKAFEIPTGLLICWPFTSMKEKLVGLGLHGWSKYFPQFLRIVHVFHDLISHICCLSIRNLFYHLVA